MKTISDNGKRNKLYSSDEVEEQIKRIRQKFLNTIISISFVLEAKTDHTSGHSKRVAEVAVAIARELRIPEERVEKIRIAGLVHDIGKIGVSEITSNKQGKLTEEEFAHIASHSLLGEKILSQIINDKEILKMVRHHHEQYDGSGYPDRLKAQNIPLGARILAVADAFDAMTSTRPYRKAMTALLTAAEMKANSGTQFDPYIINTFIKMQKIAVKSSQTPKNPLVYC